MKAGAVLLGEIRASSKNACQEIFTKQKRVQNIGSSKSRGWGRISVRNERIEEVAANSPKLDSVIKDLDAIAGPVTLRIRLRNLEPLNLAATAYAGNLIDTQPFISGSRLRGAIFSWLSQNNHGDLADRLSDSAQFGNAIPCGAETTDSILIPTPLSCEERKYELVASKDKETFEPHWAGQGAIAFHRSNPGPSPKQWQA